MRHLFSEAGLARLDTFVQPGMLCAFDFDGTLTPIVAQPDQAQMPAMMRERLMALSKYAPVAILTGRGLADMRAHMGFEPAYVVGNHGNEGLPGWEANAQRFAALCKKWHAFLRDHLRPQGEDAGVLIEDKRYSLSVHYRAAPDQAVAAARLLTLFKALSPMPRVMGGKCVFNLLPPEAVDKGWAVQQLLEISGAPGAMYIGDDITDEDVFSLKRSDVLSVRVDFFKDSAADFFVQNQGEVGQVLDALIGRMKIRSKLAC
ncbi:MAG: trehalose-phosphatase [Burkholderiales bacterium]|nr:trehalose-phosphatase [Burkholderiales bacterium]